MIARAKDARATMLTGISSSPFQLFATGWPTNFSASMAIFSLIVGAVYVSIPWEAMSGTTKFADLDNYSAAVAVLTSGTSLESNGFLEFLFSEPGWNLIIVTIALNFDDPSAGFLIISWLCASTYHAFVSRRAGQPLSILILFNPLLIDLIFSQIRSAFALALCLIAISSNSRALKTALVAYALTVHSAVFILVGAYAFSTWAQSTKLLESQWKRVFISLAVALIIAISLSHGREILLATIGDRRTEYDVDAGSVLYTTFWMIWATLMPIIAAQRNGHRNWLWIDCLTAILLSTAFFMAAFSANGVRFIALALPFLACSLGTLRKSARTIGIAALATYQCMQFLYWY